MADDPSEMSLDLDDSDGDSSERRALPDESARLADAAYVDRVIVVSTSAVNAAHTVVVALNTLIPLVKEVASIGWLDRLAQAVLRSKGIQARERRLAANYRVSARAWRTLRTDVEAVVRADLPAFAQRHGYPCEPLAASDLRELEKLAQLIAARSPVFRRAAGAVHSNELREALATASRAEELLTRQRRVAVQILAQDSLALG